VKLVSQGGSWGGIKDLVEGWYLGSASQDRALCVQQALWLMRALVEEKRMVPRFTQVSQVMITKENVDRLPGW
jgi:hypothetical protein